MPIYTFEDVVTGARSEELFARSEDACPIGETMIVRGVRMRRLVDLPQQGQRPRVQGAATLVSNALPRQAQLEAMGLAAPAYDAIGRPVFRTDAEVREFCKRSNGQYVWAKDYDGPTTTDERIQEEKDVARQLDENRREIGMLLAVDGIQEKEGDWEWSKPSP